MSTVQSSPESWLQMRPLDCAFLTLPYTPHKATTQKSRLLHENFDLLNFGILPLNLPLEMKSSGIEKKDKKHAQSQQEGYWKHQTSDKDLSKTFLHDHSCIIPRS